MSIQEKLEFFRQLIQCNHPLSLHSYSPAFIFAHSRIPRDLPTNDGTALVLLSLEEPIRTYLESSHREPLFIDDPLGLIWIAAFEYQENALCAVHILGPAYSGRNSYQSLKKELDRHNLSIHIRAKVFRNFEQIPIVPTNQLFQYAVMLHYCITDTRITTNDIQFAVKTSQNPSASEVHLITEEHPGVWIAEQEFLNMLREGNPNYPDALTRSHSLSDGPRFDTGNSLRKAKSSSIVLLTLCSRAAIEGGVSPAAAPNPSLPRPLPHAVPFWKITCSVCSRPKKRRMSPARSKAHATILPCIAGKSFPSHSWPDRPVTQSTTFLINSSRKPDTAYRIISGMKKYARPNCCSRAQT